ncbi:MAG TPA: hypothetical protein VMJ92_05400 [Candidatus Limnocylindrales bacterium]|nr:hypothetical protein [Candidatus Limnocylindrales bacterium]
MATKVKRDRDYRPVDSGVAELVGKSESELVEFWKRRFEMLAAIPVESARVGALTPQIREVARQDDTERARLMKARLQAFAQLTGDQQGRIRAARRGAFEVDRELMSDDEKLIAELARDVPGGNAYLQT